MDFKNMKHKRKPFVPLSEFQWPITPAEVQEMHETFTDKQKKNEKRK